MSREYFILSLKWSREDHATWWGPNNNGYVSVIENAGRYTQEQIDAQPDYYNDGERTLALPCEEVEKASVRITFLYALQPLVDHRLGRNIEELGECDKCGNTQTQNHGTRLLPKKAT